MTVAAFFRDARVQGALSGDKAFSSAGLIEEFFSQYGFAECTPQQLLALSDLAIRCGDLAMARDALDHAVQTGKTLHLAFYKLGRLALMQNDSASASRHFHLGTEADPNFPFNWMGEARALHARGLKDQAVIAGERFITFGVRPHAPQDLAVLADLADYLFDAGQRRRCQKLYEFLVQFGAERPRDAVRLADIHIGFGEHAAAQALLTAQEERGRLDHWGQRTLALSYSHLGEHARAIDLAEAAMLSDPANGPCMTSYLDVLARAAEPDRMRDALACHAGLLGQAGVQELNARLKLAAADLAGAANEVAAAEFAYQSRLYYLSFEMAYAALAASQLDIALALAERLGALAPADSFVKLLRIDAYFRQQMWEQAGIVLAGMTEAENQRPHVILKRFELACFTGDPVLADELCGRLDGMELPTRQFMLPIFRHLAERQRWGEVVDRALAWLDRQFNYRQIGYVLFRAAKYTGRQAEMIASIEAVEGWDERPDLARLRGNLAFDLADDLPAVEALARDPSLASDALFRRRLDIRRNVLAIAQAQSGSRALLLCSDANYLCATFVALHSAMQALTLKGLEAFVVVDDDLAELAGRAAAAFSAAGLDVHVLPASDIVPMPEKLSARYGIFTSGHRLAAAAYYRIFAARHLLEKGQHGRAVYLDSDILLRGKLDPLFLVKLNGHPLAARLEPMRPEVRRAIALHGLADDRYFNSGVLVFDLKHDRLRAGLEAALAAISDDTVTLMYHDQCALNLGFRSDFADLDGVWNTNVTETGRLSEVPPETVVLHFLDRPKPWSAAYGGEAGFLWSDKWREMAAFVGEALALEMLRLVQD